MKCTFCGADIPLTSKVGRHDTCSGCGRDLRCCKQCKFYDPRAYNECREVLAERVIDKERSNFCDYFIVRGSSKKKVNRTEDAKRALEELFRKK